MQPQPSRSNPNFEARLLFVSAVAVVTVIAVCAMSVGLVTALKRGASAAPPAASRVVSASTPLKSTSGKVVYSDSFQNLADGWSTSINESSGTTFRYSPAGYQITATGFLIHVATAPFDTAFAQLSMSLTATQSSGTPADAGFGVACRRGQGQARVRYEMYVDGTKWYVLRYDGISSPKTFPFRLKEGSTPMPAGTTPITVAGVCATLDDGVSTRVMLFVDGVNVADLIDFAPAMPGSGWLAGLIVASTDKAPSMVTATRFEVRNLAA